MTEYTNHKKGSCLYFHLTVARTRLFECFSVLADRCCVIDLCGRCSSRLSRLTEQSSHWTHISIQWRVSSFFWVGFISCQLLVSLFATAHGLFCRSNHSGSVSLSATSSDHTASLIWLFGIWVFAIPKFPFTYPIPHFLFFWIRRLGLCFVFLSEMICSTAPSGHLIWSVTWCLNIDAVHQRARKLHLFKFRLCLDENLSVNRIIILLMRNSNYFSDSQVFTLDLIFSLFHPSILICLSNSGSFISAAIGQEAGCNLDRFPVCHSTNAEGLTTIRTHIHTPG